MDTKIDVVIMTKDPNFVLPDGVGGIPVNDVIVETSTPLAKARQRAIAKVTTDWFVFIDDDIILPDDWWEVVYESGWLRSLLWPRFDNIGAVQGTAIPYGLGKNYDSAFFWHLMGSPAGVELNGNSRMFTHNTLIRTEAVRDWNPPADLSSYEDYHMMRHIQKRGYKVFVVKTETYHLHSWPKLWSMGRWGTNGMLRFFPKSQVIKRFAGIPLEYLRYGWCIGTVNAVKQTAGMRELIGQIVGGK